MIVADSLAILHRELGIPPGYARSRGLPFQAEASPGELVVVARNDRGQPILLTTATAMAWERMRAAAALDQIALVLFSGFRSVTRQAEIVRAKLAAGQALADILGVNAAPGYSEHHTGRALDLGTPGQPPLVESFADTAAYVWLTSHAGDFGFTLSYPKQNPWGIAFEPWHWLYRG